MKIYTPHPAALAFPLIKDDEMEALKRSLLERGQDFPAVLLDGKLLDGRNRQEALRQLVAEKKLKADTQLKVVPFRGGSIAGFVRAANVDRRHLSVNQRAAIATKLLPLFRREAKDRQRQAAKATSRKKKQPELIKKDREPVRRASDEAARAAGGGVSGRTVERAEFIRKTDPALFKQMLADEVTLKQAEKKIRRRVQDKQVKAYVPPTGKFQVITTDFSWSYDDKLDGSDAVRGSPPYPPQTVAEIVAFIDGPLAACADEVCLYGCWVTNPILLDLNTWPFVQGAIEHNGFRPVKLNTWRKIEESGKPFTGLGNGQRNDSEQLVLFARGTVLYNELGEAHGRPLQRTVFDAPIGEHSEKPQLAYDRLEQLVPYTSRLEMFARAPRKGWVTSGAELAQAPASGDAAPAPVGGEQVASTLPAPSFSQPAAPEHFESERSDDWDAGSFECTNCKATFVSREILSKHAKACGEVVSVVDAIATGAAVIEINKDREAVLIEVKRLAASRPLEGSVADKKLKGLEKALEDFRARKRRTKADREELAKRNDFGPDLGHVGGDAMPDPAGFTPPLVPGSTTAPPDDGIDF